MKSFALLVAVVGMGCLIQARAVGPGGERVPSSTAGPEEWEVQLDAEITAMHARFDTEGCPATMLRDLYHKDPLSRLIYDYKKLMKTSIAERERAAWQPRFDALRERAIDCVALPANAYVGKDRAKIEKMFWDYATTYTRKKVLAVSIHTSDWERKKWVRDTPGGGEYMDEALLEAWVVVEDDNGAKVWNFMLRKDYMNDGKLAFDAWFTPAPVTTIRLEKLPTVAAM